MHDRVCMEFGSWPAKVLFSIRLQAKGSPTSSQILDEGAVASQEGVATLLVVTEDAILYIYHIQDLQGLHQPSSSLEHTRMILDPGNERFR